MALEENEINKGAQIGKNATQGYLNSFQNLSGLAGQGIGESGQQAQIAGSQFSTVANQQAEGKAAQLGFITSLGGDAAAAAGACWIAEALFGEEALETLMIRHYLLNYASQHWFGGWCVRRYIAHGLWVAGKIRESKLWRWPFRQLFVWLFRRARQRIPEEEQRGLFDKYWATSRRSRLVLTAEVASGS